MKSLKITYIPSKKVEPATKKDFIDCMTEISEIKNDIQQINEKIAVSDSNSTEDYTSLSDRIYEVKNKTENLDDDIDKLKRENSKIIASLYLIVIAMAIGFLVFGLITS